MPRPLRPDHPGAIHHVTFRGNRREIVFRDDQDRMMMLDELAMAGIRVRWLLLSYCLMGNHAHLLVECPEGGLSRGVQLATGRYAKRYHRRHGTRDHHFGDRFKSTLVETDEQLLMTVLYIARNPVTAGLCEQPGDWEWSSHRAIVSGDPSGFVAVERITALLGGGGLPGRDLYMAALGDERSDLPPPIVPRARPPLEDLLRDRSDAALHRAWSEHGYPMREIARVLGCSTATVSRRLSAT